MKKEYARDAIAYLLWGLVIAAYYGRTVVERPDVAWKWRKWTFGFWTDPDNWTIFGIDFGPLEVVWHDEGYRP